MSNGDGASLAQRIVRKDTLNQLRSEQTESETPGRSLAQRIVTGDVGPSFVRRFPEPEPFGSGAAFISGIKSSFLSTIPGVHVDRDPRIDTFRETSAELVGSLIGYGASFAGYSAATGGLLGAAGLTAKLGGSSAALFKFVRNTVAGTAQFAAEAETLEEVPKNVALGIAFGGVIEGFFFARGLRAARAAETVLEGVDDAAKMQALSPSISKTAERMTDELGNIQAGRSFDESLADLSATHVESVRIPGVTDASTILEGAAERYPGAQIMSRPTHGGQAQEVFIHSPINSADRLTPKQIGQWQTNNGYFEGLEAVYNKTGKSYELTGVPVAEGRVQLRDLERPSLVFAPRASEVSIPIEPRVFTSSTRAATRLRETLSGIQDEVGFVIVARTGDRARRGIVNTTDFETVGARGIQEYVERNQAALRDINAGSIKEAAIIHAQRNGVRGLIQKEGDLTTKIHIFDQEAIQFVQEPPRQLKSALDIRIEDIPTSIRHVKPKSGQRVTLFRGVGTELGSVQGALSKKAAADFYSQSPTIAERYSQRLLNEEALIHSEGTRVIYEQGASPTVIEVEYVPNKILDLTGDTSVPPWAIEEVGKISPSSAAILRTGAKEGIATINLKSVQTAKGLFDRALTEGYDTILFRDFSSGGIDISVVPLVEDKLNRIATYSTDLRVRPDLRKTTGLVPRLGIDVDNAVTTLDDAGRVQVHSFDVSWKNGIIGPLRLKGLPEKEIQAVLDAYEISLGQRLNDLMDPEFKAMRNASQARFFEGCL